MAIGGWIGSRPVRGPVTATLGPCPSSYPSDLSCLLPLLPGLWTDSYPVDKDGPYRDGPISADTITSKQLRRYLRHGKHYLPRYIGAIRVAGRVFLSTERAATNLRWGCGIRHGGRGHAGPCWMDGGATYIRYREVCPA
ncbi:uncharacterized protein BO80DRAFT_422919 [Aspergillus ibericus CBS 121593]|uniref:Uncharacterized protein n=1 Tax=Aspergillus ibericus CBS 121593 TaxID=1448316 RepID=A0A395H8H7_9EURO|nr:hypothetical protein BO80DRAFT_422919 [Aspergillus ibericus CBS 121593]RAL03455.1 hypothetical protein BO80DRAFT_422919 [Aspergillus ibericus CBS 121593]